MITLKNIGQVFAKFCASKLIELSLNVSIAIAWLIWQFDYLPWFVKGIAIFNWLNKVCWRIGNKTQKNIYICVHGVWNLNTFSNSIDISFRNWLEVYINEVHFIILSFKLFIQFTFFVDGLLASVWRSLKKVQDIFELVDG